MSDKKELKFSIVVDPAAAQAAQRVIRALIVDAEKLTKTLGSVNIGGGSLLSGGSVGGPQTQGQMIAAATAPKQQGPITNQSKSLAQVFIDSGKGIKDLANISRDSMRVMSDGIKRGIDEQKRSIATLDSDLEKLAERYKQVSQARKIAEGSGSVSSDVIEKLATNEHVLLERQQELLVKRESQRKDLGGLDERRRQIAIATGGGGGGDDDDGGGGGGGGWRGRARAAFGRGARWSVVGGSVLAGVVGGAQELQAQPFDFVTQQARQAQAMGTMGVATRGGDLRYAAAMMQVFQDKDKMKEFLGVGNQNISTGISTGIGGAIGGLFQGNVNVVGTGIRAIEGIQSTEKERLRQYMEQQIQTDPRFYSNLERFQGEAEARVSVMRRTGYGEHNLYGALKNAGEDMGTFGGAFEATRAGGRSFAQQALWQALRANRGGMDMGAAGSLLAAGAAAGTGTALFNSVTTGNDVVAAEHLARAIVLAMQQSSFGPGSGLGLAGAMGTFGKTPAEVYLASQMAQGVQAFGQITSGGDTFGTGVNVLSANKIVGAGGDIYRKNQLIKLMQPGNESALLDAMTGSDPQGYFKSLLGDTFQSDSLKMFQDVTSMQFRARTISQGGAGLTPASRAMEAISNQFGGDARAWFQSGGTPGSFGPGSPEMIKNFAGGLTNIFPNMTTQAAEGAARLLLGAGDDGNLLGGGLGDASHGSAAGAFKKGKIKTAEEEMQDFVGANKKFLTELSADMKTIGNIFDRMSGIDLTADHAAQSLIAMADAADAFTRRQGGTPPDRDQALDALRRKKQEEMAGGGSKMMSKAQAEKLHKGYEITHQASPEAMKAFKTYGLEK